MSPQDKKLFLAKEWFLRSQDDEAAIKSMFKSGDWPANVVCFLSQQMAEKILKGFLIFHGIRFPKTHLLEELLRVCKEVDQSFGELEQETRYLSDFYISTRYPGDYPSFSFDDARIAFQEASKIKDFVFKKVIA